MAFVMAGMEDLAIYELCSKISDIKSKEDIHSVGHYTFPVGMTGGKTEVQKLVFETAVSFHILRKLRTVQCLFSFVAAGNGLCRDKTRSFAMLNRAIVMEDGTGRLKDQFREAIETWGEHNFHHVNIPKSIAIKQKLSSELHVAKW